MSIIGFFSFNIKIKGGVKKTNWEKEFIKIMANNNK